MLVMGQRRRQPLPGSGEILLEEMAYRAIATWSQFRPCVEYKRPTTMEMATVKTYLIRKIPITNG